MLHNNVKEMRNFYVTYLGIPFSYTGPRHIGSPLVYIVVVHII